MGKITGIVSASMSQTGTSQPLPRIKIERAASANNPTTIKKFPICATRKGQPIRDDSWISLVTDVIMDGYSAVDRVVAPAVQGLILSATLSPVATHRRVYFVNLATILRDRCFCQVLDSSTEFEQICRCPRSIQEHFDQEGGRTWPGWQAPTRGSSASVAPLQALPSAPRQTTSRASFVERSDCDAIDSQAGSGGSER